MGGQETIRGIMYQGFASVLEALCHKDWDKISVDLPNLSEKVDINLEKDGVNVKSIQVKSTKNTFSKRSIQDWLSELIKNIKSEEYELFLIGQCDKDAIAFKNSITKYKEDNMDKIAEESLNGFDKELIDDIKINFVVLPIDESILEAIVRDALHHYIYENNDRMMTFNQIALIAAATLSNNLLSSTKNISINRCKFNDDLKKNIDLVLEKYSEKRETIGVKSIIHDLEKVIDESNNLLNFTEKFDGRILKDKYDWNEDIYNCLLEYLRTNTCKKQAYQIILDSHTSIAFSVGRILNSKSGVNIFPLQKATLEGEILWDVKLSNHQAYDDCTVDFKEIDQGELDTALILNITHHIYDDVNQYIEEEKLPIGRIIDCTVSDNKCSKFSIKDGTHASILANSISTAVAKRTKQEKNATLHIFASAPNGLMFFLGQNSGNFGQCILYEHNYENKGKWTYTPSIKYIN